MKTYSLGLKLFLALAGALLLGATGPVLAMPAPRWSPVRTEVIRDQVGNYTLWGGRARQTRAAGRIIGESVPTYGTVRLLAIPIEFQPDNDATTSGTGIFPYKSWGPASQPGYLNTRLQQLSAYYASVSGGRVTLTCKKEDPVRLPMPMSYYSSDATYADLMYDTLAMADNKINFAQYDIIMLIHAGAGLEIQSAADGAGYTSVGIWSHHMTLPPANALPTNDGVAIGSWAVVPETQCSDGFLVRSNPNFNVTAYEIDPTVYPNLFVPEYWDVQGVWAHEIGHAFGLPDVYDVNYGGGTSIDDYSLMGAGSWLPNFPWNININTPFAWLVRYDPTATYYASVPCHMDAWCKALLGWSTVCNVTTPRSNERIRPQEGGLGWIYRLWTGGDISSREYYLIENRDASGYDRYIPNSGLMIYHIDDNIGSIARDDIQTGGYAHPRINPVPASGSLKLWQGYYIPDWKTPFPYFDQDLFTTIDHLGDLTTPSNSNSYGGDQTAVDISNIHWDGTDIVCNLRTSVPQPIVFTTPQANEVLYVSNPTVRVSIDNLTGVSVTVNNAPITNFDIIDIKDPKDPNVIIGQRVEIPLGPLTTGMYTVAVSGVDSTLQVMKSATLNFWIKEKTLPGGLTMISLPVMGVGTQPIGIAPTVFLGQQALQLAWWNPQTRANAFYPDPLVELTAPEWTAADRNSQPPAYHPPAGRGFWAKLSSQNVLQLIADVLPQDQQYVCKVIGTSPTTDPYQ
ncbi:MAG TPA: M6 family metalloprotease domain-containing protein, partial [Armatimonadota bacterium]